MPKGKLSGAWADLLPQESTKRKVIPHENTPSFLSAMVATSEHLGHHVRACP